MKGAMLEWRQVFTLEMGRVRGAYPDPVPGEIRYPSHH